MCQTVFILSHHDPPSVIASYVPIFLSFSVFLFCTHYVESQGPEVKLYDWRKKFPLSLFYVFSETECSFLVNGLWCSWFLSRLYSTHTRARHFTRYDFEFYNSWFPLQYAWKNDMTQSIKRCLGMNQIFPPLSGWFAAYSSWGTKCFLHPPPSYDFPM